MARELSLSMDETMRQMSVADETVAQPIPQPSMPDYVAEWFESSSPCLCRAGVAGVVHWKPNEAFFAFWSAHSPVHGADSIMAISGEDTSPDRHSADDAWSMIISSDEDRRALFETMYSTYGLKACEENVTGAPTHFEGECPRLIHINVDGTSVGPLRYTMRMVKWPHMLKTWECWRIEHVVGAGSVGGSCSQPSRA